MSLVDKLLMGMWLGLPLLALVAFVAAGTPVFVAVFGAAWILFVITMLMGLVKSVVGGKLLD